MYSVTNSERSSAACPQRWLLKYGLALRPERRSRALDVGSFVHDGLERLYDAVASGAERPLSDALAFIDERRSSEVDRIEAGSASTDGLFDPVSYVDPGDIRRVNDAARDAAKLLAKYDEQWHEEFKIIRNEGTVWSPVLSPSGRPSSRTAYAGKVDKVIEYRGRRLIMEHKTTSLPLADWFEKHRRSPQVRGYAYALLREGYEVDGVIYDLIQSRPPVSADSIKTLKDGSRLAKSKGLPWTTASEFATAVLNCHAGSVLVVREDRDAVEWVVDSAANPESVGWYLETYDALLAREVDGFWFRREVEMFEAHEIERTALEIYHDATRIRRWKERTESYRNRVIEADVSEVPGIVEEGLQMFGFEFARQSSLCWQWNRLCPYAALCSSQSSYDVHGFRIERSADGHSELQEVG
jgi:hypothetical protein